MVPSQYAAEMAPFDPMMGEFIVLLRRAFLTPGFGVIDGKPKGARAVVRVRSLDIPFILEDGLTAIALWPRGAFADVPRGASTARTSRSNYQAQGLKLSKHFK